MPLRKQPDGRQLVFDFSSRVESIAENTRLIAESATRPIGNGDADTVDEDELHVELAVACKRAIRQSGLSREQTLDRINQVLGRTEETERKPISMGVFNNWLSKPAENPIPVRTMLALCQVTDSLEPFEALVGRFGAVIVPQGEQVALLLGKLQTATLEAQRLKRQLTNQLRQAGGN